jgi:hypothetical protein
MQGNFLVFAHASPRACPRRIVSLPTQSERTRQFQATTQSDFAYESERGRGESALRFREDEKATTRSARAISRQEKTMPASDLLPRIRLGHHFGHLLHTLIELRY